MADDRWPSYPVGPEDHLYVLGVISLNFNLYEWSLAVLIEEHLNKEVSAFLSDKLNNEERARLIRLLTAADNYGDDLADEAEYILRHFAICAENRHILLHSRPAFLSGPVFGQSEILELEKFKRGAPEKTLTFKLEISDLRRTADEMRAGFNYMVELWRYLFERNHFFKVVRQATKVGLSEEDVVMRVVHPTLPKRPPEPRKISPHPPFEVR